MAEQHPGLDALADLLATGAPESDPHLESCAPCGARLAQLRSALVPVASSLASLPLPDPPQDLDRRITGALDRLRAQQDRGAPAGVASIDRKRAAGRLAWLPIAGGLAAAAALVFAVVVVNDDGRPSIDAGARDRVEAATHTSSTGLGYAKDGKLLAVELPALLNGTAAQAQSAGVDTALSAQPRPAQSAPKNADVPDPLAQLRTTAGLASCLVGVTDGEQAQLPLALDYASFEREPALVVVLQSAKPDKVDVFVVGASCSQADAHLLYFTRLNAPS